MKDHKGFSLIELIVTVAILAIAASLVVGSFNLIYVKNTQKCASAVDALLSKTKICAMSRAGDIYLKLYQTEDGIFADYCEGGTAVQTDKVGKANVAVSWNDGTEHALEGNPLYLSFARGTGAFTTLAKSFAMGGQTYAGADSAYCAQIVFAGGGAARVIELAAPTGSHRITAG